MDPIASTVTLLGIRVTSIMAANSSSPVWRIDAEVIDAHKRPDCSTCAEPLISLGWRTRIYADLPIGLHGSKVKLRRRRYRCPGCHHVVTTALPTDFDERRGITRRAIEHIACRGLLRPFRSVASEVGVSEKTVRTIVSAVINDLAVSKTIKAPEYLGIDECHLKNNAGVVFTDLELRKVVDMAPSYSRATVVERLMNMHGLEKVKAITMDMHVPYQLATDDVAWPQRTPPRIIDKRHVLEMARRAMEKVRLAIQKEEKLDCAKLSTSSTRRLDARLFNSRWGKLNAGQKIVLEARLQNSPKLKAAYKLKESFYNIYNNKCRKAAETSFDRWSQSISQDVASAFNPVVAAVNRRREEVFSYFDHRLTNAAAECMNRLIKDINRDGRGYGFEILRGKVLYKHGCWTDEDVKGAVARWMAGVQPSHAKVKGKTSLLQFPQTRKAKVAQKPPDELPLMRAATLRESNGFLDMGTNDHA